MLNIHINTDGKQWINIPYEMHGDKEGLTATHFSALASLSSNSQGDWLGQVDREAGTLMSNLLWLEDMNMSRLIPLLEVGATFTHVKSVGWP